MLEGALIAESLRDGTTLDGIRLVVRKITRHTPGRTTADQPATWTIIDFEADEADADGIAQALAGVLDQPGWYADFRSDTETFVVFPGRVFRYHRGDAAARAATQTYGSQLGIPQPQLDWTI